MSKIAVIYWSGTGNTRQMAEAVAEGVKEAGGEGVLLTPGEFSADMLSMFSAIAFGCSAMGSEVLEESEFEPMFAGVEGSLGGKRVALFGSYGWGDGQWMRDWWDRCNNAGVNLVGDEGLIANETPDADALTACRALGKSLV